MGNERKVCYNEKTQGTVQKGCLVLEGGAFRGLYNQGVLDAFLEQDINIHTVMIPDILALKHGFLARVLSMWTFY